MPSSIPRRQLIFGFSLLALALAAVIVAWRAWREEQTAAVLAGIPSAPDVSHWPAEFGRRLQAEESAIRSGPEPTAALGRLASLYFANNFPNEAGRALGVLREVEPKNAHWPYLAAHLRERVGDLPGTEFALRETTTLDPGYAPAWLQLGDLLVQRESFAEAEHCYSAALAIAPEGVRTRYALILFEAYHNPRVDSRRELQLLVDTHPGVKPLHELLARMNDVAGDTVGAAMQNRRAAGSSRDLPRDDPWIDGLFSDCYDPDMLSLMTYELVREGRYDDATARIERAISLAPTTPALRDAFARVRLAQNRPEDALAILRTAVKECPDDPGLRERLALRLQAGHQYDEAQMVLHDALARWPQRASLQVALGRVLQDAGQLQAALAAFHEAVRLEPASAEAQGALAQGLYVTGQREAARAAARQALQIQPAYPEALALEAHLALEDQDFAGAETPITQLIALRPHDPDAQRLFAILQLQKGIAKRDTGYLPGAEQIFLAGLKVFPDYAPLLHEEGLLAQQQGRTDDARQCFERGLRAAETAGNQAQVEEFRKLLGR